LLATMLDHVAGPNGIRLDFHPEVPLFEVSG
jgi:hypothetical protein